MIINKGIRLLRISALLLFVVPFLGLIGSLSLHNYLVSYDYPYQSIFPFKSNKIGSTFKLSCTKENNWCYDYTDGLDKISKLDQCYKYSIQEEFFSIDGLNELTKLESEELLKKKNSNY